MSDRTMKLARWCKLADLNWAALTELLPRIERLGVAIDAVSVTLKLFPDDITYCSLAEASAAVRNNGAPRHFDLQVSGKRDKQRFQFSVSRLRNFHDQEVLRASVDGIVDTAEFNTLTEFLGLTPEDSLPSVRQLKRSVFIAHRFNEYGNRCAERVARFLELLGFTVVTGRTYSPRPISEKVRERIMDQDLLFVILTPGADDTWLTQEPIVAEARDKPVFLLKQLAYEYKSGLLGDREYIPFPEEHIEGTFIPILEGLRELNFQFTGEK